MPKTTSPGMAELEHGTFEAGVLPDVFDARDLEYRSRLQVLPREVDCRPQDRYVLTQEGSSCTGHAVAAMVNAILANQGDDVHVSPYMLYALARRYDEFEGEADAGSSLRGVLKGWFYHGVLPEDGWPRLEMAVEPDLDRDDQITARALERPLGAFYRVNATRLDDMQSAVTELFGIVASASIHDGWYKPVEVERTIARKKRTMFVISRTPDSKAVGGHAFCIVGYNEVGFLVQNSWGREWGDKGFATLPYDDWLESGYDGWVARPGVPSVVSRRVRSKLLSRPGEEGLSEAPGPDLQILANHVVNLGNDGRLSQNGRFTSTKTQIEGIFGHLERTQASWGASPQRIVLYAHGGLNSEETGLDIAQRQLNWWLTNEVYPITFAWQTGVTETLTNQLSDLIRARTPAGGFGFDLIEQVDRMIEKAAKRTLKWTWDEMKENAASASTDLPDNWQARQNGELAGGSVVVAKLREYLDEHPGEPVEIHLVGHSAGSIFLAALLKQLKRAKIPVESLTYLAAAIRTDEWVAKVLPRLRAKDVKRFTAFGMSPTRELDDVCGAGGVSVYRKSLLYLVSRAFERPIDADATEVPLVGMAKFADTEVRGTTFRAAVEGLTDGVLVWSPSSKPIDGRSDSASHGGFDDDSPTMTSVLLRILDQGTLRPGNEYIPNLPTATSSAAVLNSVAGTEDQPPEIVVAEVVESDVGGSTAKGLPAAAALAPQPATRSAARPGPDEDGAEALGNRAIEALRRAGWSIGAN